MKCIDIFVPRRIYISVCKINEKDIEKYGIIFGKKLIGNEYKITKIIDKPKIKVAK